MVRRHSALEAIAEMLPNKSRMLGLDCWLSVCGKSKGASLAGRAREG